MWDRRRVQFVSIGMPTICYKKKLSAKTTKKNVVLKRNLSILMMLSSDYSNFLSESECSFSESTEKENGKIT